MCDRKCPLCGGGETARKEGAPWGPQTSYVELKDLESQHPTLICSHKRSAHLTLALFKGQLHCFILGILGRWKEDGGQEGGTALQSGARTASGSFIRAKSLTCFNEHCFHFSETSFLSIPFRNRSKPYHSLQTPTSDDLTENYFKDKIGDPAWILLPSALYTNHHPIQCYPDRLPPIPKEEMFLLLL